MARYEAYRRAGLPKTTVKRVCVHSLLQKFLQNVMGTSIQPSTAIVAAGAGKIFVGELTEKAKDIMEAQGESGPIEPRHIREAFRQYKEQTGLMSGHHSRVLFR